MTRSVLSLDQAGNTQRLEVYLQPSLLIADLKAIGSHKTFNYMNIGTEGSQMDRILNLSRNSKVIPNLNTNNSDG